MLICETDRFSMATRQYPRLALFAVAIKRPDGVNHKLRIKISARCHPRLARMQSANLADDLSALGKDGRTSRVMDCSIHSASSKQGRVRSVHNRVSRLFGDIRRSFDRDNLPVIQQKPHRKSV